MEESNQNNLEPARAAFAFSIACSEVENDQSVISILVATGPGDSGKVTGPTHPIQDHDGKECPE